MFIKCSLTKRSVSNYLDVDPLIPQITFGFDGAGMNGFPVVVY